MLQKQNILPKNLNSDQRQLENFRARQRKRFSGVTIQLNQLLSTGTLWKHPRLAEEAMGRIN